MNQHLVVVKGGEQMYRKKDNPRLNVPCICQECNMMLKRDLLPKGCHFKLGIPFCFVGLAIRNTLSEEYGFDA